MTHVRVTGGAGFIGAHVVAALHDAGHWVTVADTDHHGAYWEPPHG